MDGGNGAGHEYIGRRNWRRAGGRPLLSGNAPAGRPRDEIGWQSLQQGTASSVFRPKRTLWVAAWVTFSALTLPLYAALYFLTVPAGRWLPFAVSHVVLVLLFAVVAQRLKAAGLVLAPDGIREREYFSAMVFTPVAAIASVVVVKLCDSYGEQVSRQLFMLDAEGRTLLRLRGQLWHRTDFDRIAEFYPVPLRVVEPALTWREFRRDFGCNLDRWERRPVLTASVLTVIAVAVALAMYLAVTAAIA